MFSGHVNLAAFIVGVIFIGDQLLIAVAERYQMSAGAATHFKLLVWGGLLLIIAAWLALDEVVRCYTRRVAMTGRPVLLWNLQKRHLHAVRSDLPGRTRLAMLLYGGMTINAYAAQDASRADATVIDLIEEVLTDAPGLTGPTEAWYRSRLLRLDPSGAQAFAEAWRTDGPANVSQRLETALAAHDRQVRAAASA